MKKLLIAVITVIAVSQNLIAGVGLITNVKIDNVAAIGVGYGGHIAGNMEIKVKNGFTLPPGVYCDTNYITTRKTVDPDRYMFNLLRDAFNAQRQVSLYITDDPAFTAFPGRCSIFIVVDGKV